MNKNRFVSLIVGFCELCSVEEPMRIVHGNPVQVDGINFSLVYSEKINPLLFHIYCDIGALPPEAEVEAYRRLLRKNFLESANRGPVFSLPPDSGRVLLSRHEDLAEMTPALLLDRLKELAAEAREWSKDPLPADAAVPQRSKQAQRLSTAAASTYRQLARS